MPLKNKVIINNKKSLKIKTIICKKEEVMSIK